MFTYLDDCTELRCAYERNGSLFTSGLRFHSVRAYRFRAESHCSHWHIDGAYDTLVEVERSDWVEDLMSVYSSAVPWPWAVHHFLIYIEDSGAYEVAAERYEWISEVAM